MKLVINYDLIDKIREANTGISLNKSSKFILKCTSINIIIGTILSLIPPASTNYFKEELPKDIIIYLIIHTFLTIIREITFSKFLKVWALNDLNNLASRLKDLDINTSYELLLEAYKYKTEYKINTNNNFSLEEKKFIMVPAYVNGEEKEISLVQEHIIGSKEYYLSYGEPNKVLKLAFNHG